MSTTTVDPAPYRRLAVALIQDAIITLKTPPPTAKRPPAGERRKAWVTRWEAWERSRMRDLAFFRDGKRAAPWCEAAGLDYGAVMARLEDEGLLYDSKDRFPIDVRGRSLLYG